MTDSTNPMEVCPKCGARQRDPEARFCQFCGEIMPAAAATRRRIILGSAGLVLTLLVVVVVIRLIGKGGLGSRDAPQAATAGRASSVTLAVLPQGDLPAASSTVSLAPATSTVSPTLSPTAVPATQSPELPTASPEPSEASSSTPATRLSGYVDRPAGSLDLRSGPDMAYAPITGVQNGATLEIVGRTATGDWLLVRMGDGVGGWLPTLFVRTASSLVAVPVIAAAPRPTRARPSPTLARTPRPPAPTPRPGPNPRFRTDKASIRGGDCATLRWDVEKVRAVYLDGNPQGGHGLIIVCPPASRTFVLTIVLPDGDRVDWPLEIEVSGAGAPPQFLIEHPGCLPHELRLGQVKGRVFDRNGRIIVGALVEILVEGQPGIVPVGRTNEEGWYEFNLRSGHDATFVRLEIDGQSMSFYPKSYTVTAKSRCYQQVDFRQR